MTATDPVRFGVIGVGRITQNRFAPALANASNATLVAAASRDEARAAALGAKAYGRYDDLIADGDVEAVYIATHNGLHRDLTLQALAAGKHVLCEKPLGRNATECEEVINAAQAANLHLVEAFMYRHHPQVAKAAELVKAGAIGEVKVVEASFSFHLEGEDDVRLNPEWGGGGLLDVGCYCVNWCRLFLGDQPVAVRARAAFHPEHDVDMSLHGVLDYGDGRFGVVSCGFDSGLRHPALLSGTEGIIRVPEAFLTFPGQTTSVILENASGAESFACGPVDTFQCEIEDLSDSIRVGRPPLLPPDEGLHNARVMASLLAAARES